MQNTNNKDDYKFLWLILILFVNLIVYFPSLFHAARPDQNAYLFESSELKSFQDNLSFAYNYTRSHLANPSEKFLFRPLYHIVLLMQRELVGYNFFIWQFFSFGLHIWVVYQFLSVLTFIFPRYFSFSSGRITMT